jgi:hypothetical protein
MLWARLCNANHGGPTSPGGHTSRGGHTSPGVPSLDVPSLGVPSLCVPSLGHGLARPRRMSCSR